MQASNKTPEQAIKLLQLIHGSICIVPLIFSFYIYISWKDIRTETPMTLDILIYIVPLIGMMGYFMGSFLFKKQLDAIDTNTPLAQKLSRYTTACVLKYALLEGPTLLALAAFMFTNNALYLSIAAVLLLLLFFLRPKKERILKQLPLTLEQKQLFK